MTKRAQQIYMKTTDAPMLEGLLAEYADTFANEFVQCSSVRLEGVAQVLASLVRKKREFLLYIGAEWTVIWEIVEHTDFADPSVARFLSEKTDRESIWVKLDDDFNIWAYQVFRRGASSSEAFLPESYFSGNAESEDRFNYGSCNELAESFNSTRDLPLFLQSSQTLERNRKISNDFRKVICKLPGTDQRGQPSLTA